jgi:hypothetical protein
MGLKDTFDKIAKTASDALETAKHAARDAASEAQHHAAAQAEQHKREGAGDSLSPVEVTQSVATQVREETLAKVDSLKQGIRNNI